MTKVMRPETFAQWVRRKNRWTRRRQKRLVAEGELRTGLHNFHMNVLERIQSEADQHLDQARSTLLPYASPTSPGHLPTHRPTAPRPHRPTAPSSRALPLSLSLCAPPRALLSYQASSNAATTGNAFLSGALTLREWELTSLWSASNAVAKAVHYTERSELPRWAEALRPAPIAVGIARWMFNALSYGLPRVAPKDKALGFDEIKLTRLPQRNVGHAYWAHFDWLVGESERREGARRRGSVS